LHWPLTGLWECAAPRRPGVSLYIRLGLRRLRRQRRQFGLSFPGGDDLIDDPVALGLLGCQDEVAVGVMVDLFDGLAGVLGDDLLKERAVSDNLLGLDLDVDGLALRPAVGLVEEDSGVGQRVALPLRAA